METNLLAGPSQFTLEAWNYLWRHRWFLASIAFIPWILETAGEYSLSMVGFNEGFFLSPLNKILQPFWAIIWLGYLLKPATQPTVKNCFKVNINYAWYVLYALVLSVSFIGIDYLLKSFGVHLGVIFLVYILWNVGTIIFLLLFPALALNKHIFIKDVWKLSRPFWGDFLKSGLIGLFLSFLVLAILFLLLSTSLSLLPWQPPQIANVAAINFFGIWADAFLLTITGIYYKRYILE